MSSLSQISLETLTVELLAVEELKSQIADIALSTPMSLKLEILEPVSRNVPLAICVPKVIQSTYRQQSTT